MKPYKIVQSFRNLTFPPQEHFYDDDSWLKFFNLDPEL